MQKLPLIFLLGVVIMSRPSFAENIKKPNVSGTFYPSDKKELQRLIDRYLSEARIEPAERKVALIVAPHAGYVYSGPVAAYGYKFISRQKYTTVVVLAGSHYYGFDGISIGEFDAYRTPLGDIPVDKEMASAMISKDGKFVSEPGAFEQEHSLEVEIPFIQTVLPGVKIVPVIFGQPRPETVKKFASSLNEVIGSREDVLIVVSTDLSHYHDGKTAKSMDRDVMELFRKLDAENLWKKNATRELEMCGFVAATAAVLYSKERGFSDVRLLHYAHSGDVTGDNERVVGYGALAVFGDALETGKDALAEKKNLSLNDEQKKRLLIIARETIENFVQHKKVIEVEESDPRLKFEEGAFVTIRKKGSLRGCIGNIIGQGPLYRTVRDMAVSSCSQDPRFPPVSKEELKDIHIEISVLSKPRKAVPEEIEMGKHGVIVSRGFQGGVFLPQVATETGWSKEEFMSQLCYQKAGLPPDCWRDPRTNIEIFTADVFEE